MADGTKETAAPPPALCGMCLWSCALFLLAFATGTLYFSYYEGTPANNQHLMGPAVMLACGQGFINPDIEALPALKTFLTPTPSLTQRPQVDRFDPATLPVTIPQLPVDGYQVRHQYLLYAVAAVWKVSGISWAALAPLHGLLYGCSALAFYALFRCAVSRPWAILGTLLLIFSPMQLNNLLRLRDYAKAPFLLAAMGIALFLLRPTLSRRGLIAWAAVAGLVLGVGYGFRQDTFIAMPALTIVLLCLAGQARGLGWRARLAGVAACWMVFCAASFPALREMGESCKYHYLVQGLCGIYDGRLGAGDAPYTVVHRYFDVESTDVFQAYTKYREGKFRALELFTKDYEVVGRDYSRELLKTFSADFILRAWMAVRRTIDEMGTDPGAAAPRGVANPWLEWLASGRAHVHAALVRYAHYGVPLALLLVAAFQLRQAFGLLFLLCYFCGYGAIQFAGRHTFHLQFVAVLAMLFLLEGAWRAARSCLSTSSRRKPGSSMREMRVGCGLDPGLRRDDECLDQVWHAPWRLPQVRRCAIFVLAFLLILFLPLWLSRAYQQRQVHALFQDYANAQTEPLQCHDIAETDGQVAVTLSRADGATLFNAPPQNTGFDAAFLVAEFDTTQGPVHGWIEYAASQFDFAPSWDLNVPQTSSGTTRVFFPVYASYRPATRGMRETSSCFRGLVMSPADRSCLIGVAEVNDAQRFPLWLTATLAPDWEKQPLYQRRTR